MRDGAWVAEATGLVDLSAWPEGSRLILRKERPHPGAQLTFTDVDGMRITAFLTDTPPGVIPGQVAGLELRHRQHARVEDRIREAKASRLRNLPCRGWDENAAWLEVVLTAIDLVCWTKMICFADSPRSPAARSPPSATGSCTSPPGSPAPPDRPAPHRPHLALGQPDRRRLAPHSGPRSPDTRHPRPCNRDQSPTGPRKARPTGATPDDLSCPPAIINRPSPPKPANHSSASPHAKSRLA